MLDNNSFGSLFGCGRSGIESEPKSRRAFMKVGGSSSCERSSRITAALMVTTGQHQNYGEAVSMKAV